MHRVLKHGVVAGWDPRRTAAWVPFHFDGFNPILYYLSPKIVKFLPEILIFQELLTAETQNLQHWIWHASNPKYAPLKPF